FSHRSPQARPQPLCSGESFLSSPKAWSGSRHSSAIRQSSSICARSTSIASTVMTRRTRRGPSEAGSLTNPGGLWDTFALGGCGSTSQPLYAPEDTGGTNLLHPTAGNPQDSILVLGQAYAQLRYKEYTLVTGYRQLVDEGYVNPQDSRMVPNTVEGVTI